MEESEDANPVKKHPSLPENYVTLAMLKERWLQKKKEEEEEEQLKLQRNLKPDDPTEENPNGSKPGTKPVIRNLNRPRDRRGSVKEHEVEPESIDSVAIRGHREIRGEKTKMGFRERRKPRANVASHIVASGENSGKDEGIELQLAENGVEKAPGRSRSGRKKWKKRLKRNEGRMKVQQQGEEGLRENEKKDGKGFAGPANTTPPAVKLDESFQDLSLNDPKNGNVKKRAPKIKDQQGSTRCEKMAEEERRVRGGRKDRMRRISSGGGGGGGGWRQMGHRRSSSTRVGDQLVWVKKGETSGGCVTTDFNSQVHP